MSFALLYQFCLLFVFPFDIRIPCTDAPLCERGFERSDSCEDEKQKTTTAHMQPIFWYQTTGDIVSSFGRCLLEGMFSSFLNKIVLK